MRTPKEIAFALYAPYPFFRVYNDTYCPAQCCMQSLDTRTTNPDWYMELKPLEKITFQDLLCVCIAFYGEEKFESLNCKSWEIIHGDRFKMLKGSDTHTVFTLVTFNGNVHASNYHGENFREFSRSPYGTNHYATLKLIELGYDLPIDGKFLIESGIAKEKIINQ